MESLLQDFLVESVENLDQFERDLVGLEKNPDAHEMLANAFRAIHNIKGLTGFLGLSRLGTLAHAGESLLSDLRDGRLAITPPIGSALLTLVDCVRLMLADIERTGAEADTDCASVIAHLEALRRARPLTAAPGLATAAPLPVHTTIAAGPVPVPGPRRPVLAPPVSPSSRAGHSVRVDVAQLDVLMNLVGELVLTRNEMLQYSSLHQNPVLVGSSQRLNAITTQLQAGIMKTRMQPIDTVWSTFPRIVRDIALECGKQVRLTLDGRETELDKTLLQAIKDPLTHVVRNCVDHGIETPERRLHAGKPAEGCLSLRAFHEGGQVHIEMSDDGAGIDLSAVRQRAVEGDLITTEQAEALSDQDAMRLIFLPGFSTANTITSISGRGVGMDVVKTNIEKIGGKVAVHSQRGLGTTVKIRIPLTLAIMPALVVTAAGDRFAIPQAGVLELLGLEEGAGGGVLMMGEAPVLRLRGELVPLVRLDVALGMVAARPRALDVAAGGGASVVILKAEDRKFGLVVDEVIDTQEIVVRPLDRRLGALSTFAGATIMGDGRVALILDVTGLAVHAHVLSEPRRTLDAAVAACARDTDDVTQTLLAITGDNDARMAIPLSQVMRLEEFPASSVEHTSDRDVVQYRGEMLQLVALSDLLSGGQRRTRSDTAGSHDTIKTIVYSNGGQRMGLIVGQILDTVEHRVAEQRPGGRKGVLASAVIDGRVTEILDLEVLCASVTPRAVPTSFRKEVAV